MFTNARWALSSSPEQLVAAGWAPLPARRDFNLLRKYFLSLAYVNGVERLGVYRGFIDKLSFVDILEVSCHLEVAWRLCREHVLHRAVLMSASRYHVSIYILRCVVRMLSVDSATLLYCACPFSQWLDAKAEKGAEGEDACHVYDQGTLPVRLRDRSVGLHCVGRLTK